MLTLMFLLTLGSCGKRTLVDSAKSAFRNNNCVETLKAYVQSPGCKEMFLEERQHSVIFRCKKPDNERGKFYDNYWFRISSAGLTITADILPEIEKHTICIDEHVRIEAYPPE